MTDKIVRIHRHIEDGRVVWTDGRNFPDCWPERGCWLEVSPKEANAMLTLYGPKDSHD